MKCSKFTEQCENSDGVSDPSMASISKDSMIKVKVYTCKDDAIHQCLGKGQFILSSEMDTVVLSA